MLRKCLIGSIVLHVLFIGMFDTAPPSLITSESEMIFEMVRSEDYVQVGRNDPVPAKKELEQRKVPVVPQGQPLSEPEQELPRKPAADIPSPELKSPALERITVQPVTDEDPSVIPIIASGNPVVGPEQPVAGSPGNGVPGVTDHITMPGDSTGSAQPPVNSLPEPDVPPVKIYSPGPEYPWKAKANNWEGLVVLKVEVLTNGKIGAIHVETSSGYPILDNAAKQSVKAWRYKPALKGGTPVICYIKVPVRFRLEG